MKATFAGYSVTEVLRFLGVKRMSIYVPTNEEVTMKSVKYFEDQGFEVLYYESLGEECKENITRMSPWEVCGNVTRPYKRCPDVDGIFLTGGCFRTLEMLEVLEKDTGVPVVVTTPANMWWCLQLVGVKDPIYGFGQWLEKAR